MAGRGPNRRYPRLADFDELTLVRIGRARDEATRELGRSRDVLVWQVTMARLDAD